MKSFSIVLYSKQVIRYTVLLFRLSLKVSYGILVIAFAKSKVPIFSVAKFSMNNLHFFAYDQIIVLYEHFTCEND